MLHYLESVPSTNAYLLQRGERLSSGFAVYTTHQTAGKGRRGRAWQEQAGKSLAFSCLYHFPADAAALLPTLPLVVGSSVCEMLEEACPVLAPDLAVKWSNDVLLQEKKLGGILCESKLRKEGVVVVIGVGLNLHQSCKELAEQNLPFATSFDSCFSANSHCLTKEEKRECRKKLCADSLAIALFTKLNASIERWQTEGFSPLLQAEYQRRCLTLGREVLVYSELGEKEEIKPRKGKAIAIGDKGSLRIIIDGKEQEFFAGDIRIRGAKGYI